MHNFRQLAIWTNGLEIANLIYLKTKEFPKDELYGLVSQMRRSAISIPSNIAEGSSKSSNKDFNQYLEIALGSSFELETQIIIAHDLSYVSSEDYDELIKRLVAIQKMISIFKSKILN